MNVKTYGKSIFGIAIYCCAAADSVSGQQAIPAEALTRLGDMVTFELKGHAAAPAADATVVNVSAYEGSAITADVEFVYQLFPELGVFRILPTLQAAPNGWLYISCEHIKPDEAVKVKADGSCELESRIYDRVLSCASGVLYRDITKADLSCRKIPNHFLYSKNLQSFVNGISSIQILVDANYKEIAINSSNHWRDVAKIEK